MDKTAKVTLFLTFVLLIIVSVDVYLFLLSYNRANKHENKTLIITTTTPVSKYNKLYEQIVGKGGSELITISKKDLETIYSNPKPMEYPQYPNLGIIFVGKYKALQDNNLIIENNGKDANVLLPSLFKLFRISDSKLIVDNINPRVPIELSLFHSQVKTGNYILLPKVEIDNTGIYRSDTVINFL